MSQATDSPACESLSNNLGRTRLLLRLVGLCSLLLIAATWRLWLPQQAFPQVPLSGGLSHCGPVWDWLALSCVAAGAVGLILGRHRGMVQAACGLFWLGMVGAVALDQHRLQPWAYQLPLMALALACAADRLALKLCRWLTVSIYAFSAWSKLDYSFLADGGMGQRFAATLLAAGGLPGGSLEVLRAGSWLIVMGELLVAILLLVRVTRRTGVLAAMLMHTLLLVILGPIGMNHSAGVLLWNVWFLVMIPLLFWPLATPFPPLDSKKSVRDRLAAAVILSAIIAPLLEPWGWCDSWLAWSLYSSRNEQAIVLLDPAAAQRLPAELKPYLQPLTENDRLRFRLDLWSLDSLGVPVYPENRFAVGVALKLAGQHKLDEELELILLPTADRWTGRRVGERLQGTAEIEAAAERYRLNALPRE